MEPPSPSIEQRKKPTYKYCIVPKCRNTVRNAPDKVFFLVPRGADIRRTWCKIMKRDLVSPSTCLYCCEDHFDIEEDTDNYMMYKILYLQEKQKTTLRLKKGILPHKFQCQKDTESQPPPVRKRFLKRKKLEIIKSTLPAPPAKLDCTLKRPPSVYKSTPRLKDVNQSKKIAALKNNVEHVINRLREFNMLPVHACVDHNLTPIIDDVIGVACGLINMQNNLKKKIGFFIHLLIFMFI